MTKLKEGLRYHHLGIPTHEVRPDETHLPDFGMHVSGFETSPFGVEWMRFDEDSPIPELVRTVPHIAFQVDNLEAALEGHEILIEPNSPSDGVRVAFVIHDGAPGGVPGDSGVIGVGGGLTPPVLPHHRTYGSRIRRFFSVL